MVEPEAKITVPREVFWICLIGPWLFAPLLSHDLFELTFGEALRKIAASYVPFLAIPSLLRVAYDRWLPPVLARAERRGTRFAVHAGATTAAALLVAAAGGPIQGLLLGKPIDALHWTATCVIMTWTFMLPTIVVQEHQARLAQAERLARAERQAALEAQLEALQARTNPHFFFNGVNTVASLIPEDPRLAEETLVRLADIMRYALEGSRERFVPLARELEVVRDYLEVQVARFGAKLRFEIDVEPAAFSVAVPPLFLQPLVENAVLHGLGQRMVASHGSAREPNAAGVARGEVRVSARCAADVARIEVLDDGIGPGRSQHRGSGTALVDLEQRLRLLYGNAGQLESGPRAEGGYRVCVTLPRREVAA